MDLRPRHTLTLLVLLAGSLLALASCAAPAGQGRAADPDARLLAYSPNPQADVRAAEAALIRLAPGLTVPGAEQSQVVVHFTQGLAVFSILTVGHEYQRVDKPPYYPTGYAYCDPNDLMSDCSWPMTMRVRTERTERVVVDPATITAVELFSDDRLRLTHGPGLVLELNAPDKGALLDLADALSGLARSAKHP